MPKLNNIYFQGEFHAGMMFGKGKYTWLYGDSYEGDMMNNEISGNGCYRWTNNK